MGKAGPSPVVPLIMVGFLGMLLYWPTLLSIWESVESLLEMGIWVAVVLVFLLLIGQHILSIFFPVHHFSSTYEVQHRFDAAAADGFGFGLGTLTLVFLFLVLYNLL